MSFTKSERDREEKSQKTKKLGRICKDKGKRSPDLKKRVSFTARRQEVGLSSAKNKKLGTGNFYEVALLLHVCACKC